MASPELELQISTFKDRQRKLRRLVFEVSDEPNESYPGHRYLGVGLLLLDGLLQVTLIDGQPRTLVVGQGIEIEENQYHKVMAGPEGATYLFACSPGEAKQQGLIGDPTIEQVI